MKTRREFLHHLLLGASATWTVPLFIERTFADLDQGAKDLATQAVTGKDGTILVVLQLAGGNDGLNMVVPYQDDAYHRARPRLAKHEQDIIRLAEGTGLNNHMPFLASLYDKGQLGIMRGVGYPNPNRSHFVSTTIWETADPSTRSRTGWIGRYFDNACAGSDPATGIAVGSVQPEAFTAEKNPGVCLSTPDLYRWIHNGPHLRKTETRFEQLNAPVGGVSTPGGNLEFLQRVSLDARLSSASILKAANKYRSRVKYPGFPLARNLNLVARMIAGEMPTRVYYVSHGGFDTHQNQLNTHDRVLGQLDTALQSFFADLREQGNAERVVLMTFSEFGRRVAENASAGTDHGKASYQFVIGPGVKGGLYGEQPSLTDLSEGDMRHNLDFRQVYSTVLQNWLHTPAEPVLHGTFETLPFLG